MFDEFGQSVLTDFGIAKAASGQKLTGTGMSIGTPHYMSPEQARAQPIDGRSDIYSLGIVAYQCLTGTVPYDGEDSFSIGYKHITEPIPTPSLVTADERRLFEVIKRMLMKDPFDRFQTCEELIASFQGQPIAAPGSLRVSAAMPAAAVAGAGAGLTGGGGLPPIVSQPTTPLDSPLVNRRLTPRERRELPRRVADRSLAMRPRSSSWAWLWILLAVIGGVGGAYYYWVSRGFAPGNLAADSARGPSRAAADTSIRSDTTAGQSVVAPRDTAPQPPSAIKPPDTSGRGAAADSLPPAGVSTDVTGPVDSGGIRLMGLPRGSTVLIDEQPITQALTKLPPGPHALAISAPRYNFYSDTIVIRPGQIQELTPQLVQMGAPVPDKKPRAVPGCVPGPGYNADGSCFEERPKPVNAPFVAVPPDAQPSPRPSLLWVKVSSEGRTIDIMRLRPSNDPAFERAVRNFVWTVTWHPALKDGAPVEAWTQMLFPPAPTQ